MNQADINQLNGPAIIEFGTTWCGHCQAAQSMIAMALLKYPNVKHIKIEDGKGQRLGRQFSIKRWPTLVFLNNGVELSRLVRPENVLEIENALKKMGI